MMSVNRPPSSSQTLHPATMIRLLNHAFRFQRVTANVSQQCNRVTEKLATKEWTKLEGQAFFGHFVVIQAPFRLPVNRGVTYQRDGYPHISEWHTAHWHVFIAHSADIISTLEHLSMSNMNLRRPGTTVTVFGFWNDNLSTLTTFPGISTTL